MTTSTKKRPATPPIIDDIEDEEERELTQIITNQLWEKPDSDAREIVQTVKAVGWSAGANDSKAINEIRRAIEFLTERMDAADAQITLNTNYNNNSIMRDRDLRETVATINTQGLELETSRYQIQRDIAAIKKELSSAVTKTGDLELLVEDLENDVKDIKKLPPTRRGLFG